MPLRGRHGGRRGRGGVARGCGRLTHEDAVRAQQLREARLRSTEVDWALSINAKHILISRNIIYLLCKLMNVDLDNGNNY